MHKGLAFLFFLHMLALTRVCLKFSIKNIKISGKKLNSVVNETFFKVFFKGRCFRIVLQTGGVRIWKKLM